MAKKQIYLGLGLCVITVALFMCCCRQYTSPVKTITTNGWYFNRKSQNVNESGRNDHETSACGGAFVFKLGLNEPLRLSVQPNFKDDEVEEHFYRYVLQYVSAHCEAVVRAGKLEDGGWDVCVSGAFRPVFGDCKVLSFGIEGDFSFDDFMTERYGCTVHSFDPSMSMKSTRRGERSWFHQSGLGGSDGVIILKKQKWELFTLNSILRNLDWTQQTIDVLKFDVQGSEMEALPAMLRDGSLKHVKQLMFELHTRPLGKTVTIMPSYINMLAQLDQAGFKKFMFHENLECVVKSKLIWAKWLRTRCIELYYINERYVQSPCKVDQ